MIEVDAPLSGVPSVPAAGPADVRVALHGPAADPVDVGAVPWYTSAERDDSGQPALVASRLPADGSYWLRYSEGATFHIEASGARVDAWWQSPLTSADVATYLLGPVLAFVLRLKGFVPLHASAVSVRDRALLFLGHAGAGKSTTAAAFATLGHAVLSDDVVPVIETAGGLVASPAYPRLALWADSAAALLGERSVLPAFSATYDKGYLDLLERGFAFQTTPVPVDAIFVLEPAQAGVAAPAVRRLGERDGFLALAANSYGSYLLDARLRAAEFEILTRLVAHTPVAGLSLGGDLAGVRAACAELAAR